MYPAFNHLLEDDFIHGDVGHQPFMADFVKAGFNVAFQYPFCASAFGQYDTTLFHGICTASFLAESIRVGVRLGFRNGVQCQQVQRLHGSISHCGDTERSHFPIRFRDIHSS